MCPLVKEIHFTEPDPHAAAEAEQELQRSVQQLLVEHYSGSPLGGTEVGGLDAANGSSCIQRQQLLFTREPHAAVYELLLSYEEARCTNSWDSPIPEGNPTSGTSGACLPGGCATPDNNTAHIAITEHVLQDVLRLCVSASFPGRPVRGLIFHFVELDASKLALQLINARVFDCQDLGVQSGGGTGSQRKHSRSLTHGTSSSASGTCVGCLVVRLFPYPSGLCSGWVFAGTVD